MTTRLLRSPAAVHGPAPGRVLLPAAIVLISATAWIAIWRLGQSPWGHWVHQHGGHDHTAASTPPMAALAAAFVAGWVVMTVAMMLPTILPFVGIFRRLTADRHNALALVTLVAAGYLTAWAAFGVLVFAASMLMQDLAATAGWPDSPRLPAALLFLLAGAFQFSGLKYRCLDKCRSPLSFITSRWRGARERWQSFRLGLDHGVFCVGCCWALMLLMFAAGTASLLWMLALGAIMAVEKNVSWGRRISAPLGVMLLAAGTALMLVPG